jgi:hypothetical protein
LFNEIQALTNCDDLADIWKRAHSCRGLKPRCPNAHYIAFDRRLAQKSAATAERLTRPGSVPGCQQQPIIWFK